MRPAIPFIKSKGQTLNNISKTENAPSEYLGFRDVLRFVKLQLLSALVRWRSPKEHRKIAIYKSTSIAAFHSMVHLPPLVGAITLIILNCLQFFVGDPGSSGLQFVAKLHEFLMQASIADMLLGIMRLELSKDYLPLGALLAPVHVPFNISYLWSLEFWGAVTSPTLLTRRKVVFVALIPFFTLLAVIVGPSSAVAMRPRETLFGPLDHRNFIIGAPSAKIFPLIINSSSSINVDTIRRPAYSPSHRIDQTERMFIITDEDAKSRAGNLMATCGLDPDDPWSGNVIASVPSRMSLEILMKTAGKSFGLKDTTFDYNILSSDFFQPTVNVRCYNNTPEIFDNIDLPFKYKADDGVTLKNLTTIRRLLEMVPGKENVTDVPDHIPPVWLPLPSNDSRSTVGSFLSYNATEEPFPFTDLFKNNRIRNLNLTTCTVSAFWTFAKHERIKSGSNNRLRPLLRAANPFPEGLDPSKFSNQITLMPSWLNLLNETYVRSPVHFGCLAETVVRALADIQDIGSGEFKVTESNQTDANLSVDINSTGVRVDSFLAGYGYSMSSVWDKLSIAVLGIYSISVIAYILFLIITSTTSTAWDSAIELLMLALRSRQPWHLSHVSVGVETMQTFREPVGIRVNQDEDLELVFENDSSAVKLRHVEPNKAY
ncbi:hypothetical protein CC78DRAFT_600093 [Lojkania enalia]|uniref:Uncharacterized protein n=1 Tax=Lojkania enalia TaxID=147567 RepID=A0A9P4KFV8_9PLEO|nr:hypothetical protein CC78DRAFT_600093 [Didymosphaeria enalia]